MKRIIYLSLLLLFTAYNCSRENDSFSEMETEKRPIRFSSVLFENDITRAGGTTWDSGDVIGVFAVTGQSVLSPENIIDNNENLPFGTNGDGFFYAKGKNIYYPEGGNAMDIIAYYPHTANLNEYNYPVDITEQPEIFYSNNLKGISEANQQNNGLQFRRILSRIVLNVTSKTGEGSLEGLTCTVKGAKTRADFSLADGTLSVNNESVETIPMTVSGSNTQKQASVILLPSDQENEIEILFTVGGKTYKPWKAPHKLEAGKVNRYDIQLDGLSPIGKLSGPYMETPVYTSGSTAPYSAAALHMVGDINWLNQTTLPSGSSIRNFSVLFDTENRVPYWVAFPLHPAYMGNANRTNEWQYDPEIDENLQPNLFSGWSDSGIDRGHLLASADRNATKAINETTFYFTNMAPQNSSMNGGAWAQLENRVRYWSNQSEYDTLYVVTGCILPKLPEEFTYASDKEGNESLIPKYLYKALLRKKKKTGAYTSIVFKMENKIQDNPYSHKGNIFSVKELEAETGFTFFPNLPEDVAAIVKQNKSLSPDWPVN